jgi:hypothetical protein
MSRNTLAPPAAFGRHVAIVGELRIDGKKVVDPVDLKAMAGEVDHRPVGAVGDGCARLPGQVEKALLRLPGNRVAAVTSWGSASMYRLIALLKRIPVIFFTGIARVMAGLVSTGAKSRLARSQGSRVSPTHVTFVEGAGSDLAVLHWVG